eukprot:TRINITY_DN10991_c0_g1_i1.p1 TRINITY_DN10991_c0_g1~~TRINITY_DN10991_c0_g1_i1.p1  ORF type:complete len:568 (+),score=6.36 TRINITY_DN10991_c0_g1_i1:208-1911(+)
MPVCSNISGGLSSSYPCLCGTSFAATTQCNSTEFCTASDDTDGLCQNCQNTCEGDFWDSKAHDGMCWDGGPGSISNVCSLGTDCADCGPRSTPTTTPAPGTVLCDNTCKYAKDGVCDDTGPGSSNSKCDVGTDCADCGVREAGMWTVQYKCGYCKHEGKWDLKHWLPEQECAAYCYSKKKRYMTYTPHGAIVGACKVNQKPCKIWNIRKIFHGTCRCESPELCNKIGNYCNKDFDTSKPCDGNTFMYETTQFYTTGGCSTVPLDARVPSKLTTLLTDSEATAAVLCCSLDGKQCGAGNYCAEGKNLQDAAKHCGKFGQRLCTLAEIKSDMCCEGMQTHGCGFDLKRVWTASKASACSNLVGGASSTYPCLCGLTDLASTLCMDGQFCTASNDTDGLCQDGPTPPPTPAPPTTPAPSSTPASSRKCYSTVAIGKYCKHRQFVSEIPVEYRSSIGDYSIPAWNGGDYSIPAWNASAGVYTEWDSSIESACRSSCDDNPECNGYDFYPRGTEYPCALFSNLDCTLGKSEARYSDSRHYQVTSCTSEEMPATSTAPPRPRRKGRKGKGKKR